MNIAIEIFSWFGVVLSLTAFVYQAGKTIRSKKTSGLSLITFSVSYLSGFLWITFAVLVRKFQPAIVNTFVLSATAIIIFMIFKEKFVNRKIEAYAILALLVAIPLVITAISVCDLYVTKIVNYSNDTLNLVISLFAGALGAGSFLPQFIKILKDKVTKNLSYVMIVTTLLAQVFWAMFWGMSSSKEDLGTWLFGCTFAVILGALQGCILFCKIKYERKAK